MTLIVNHERGCVLVATENEILPIFACLCAGGSMVYQVVGTNLIPFKRLLARGIMFLMCKTLLICLELLIFGWGFTFK